jgi:hypothetical protein
MEVASAGLDPISNVPVSPELLEWADIIFVMERVHRNKLSKRFRTRASLCRFVRTTRRSTVVAVSCNRVLACRGRRHFLSVLRGGDSLRYGWFGRSVPMAVVGRRGRSMLDRR